ncbi:hypothetical protein FRC17_000963 [Serendipita sp. 399]|nr:hypothetical protein FRC17_000963 [Serendipita sp. 399]
MGEWKVLGPQLTIFAASLEPINPKGYPSAPLSTAVTKAVVDVNRIISGYTLVRLMAATHIVLAGLELDIHGKEELPFVLWYGANMYRALAETMRKIVEADHGPSSFPVEKKIEDYLLSQISWANVMAHYCITASMTYLLVSNSITLSRREQVNLRRRFKWAFETTESSNGARNTHPHPSSQRHKQQSMPPPHPPSAEKQEPDSDFNDPCLPEFAEWELFLRRVVERDAASQIEKLVSMYKSLVKHLKAYGEETLQKDNSSAIVSAPQNGIIDEKPPLPPRSRTMGDVLRDIFIAGPVDPHSTTGKEAADQKVEKTIVDLQMEVINEMKATASLNLETLMRFEPSTSASPVASPRTSAEIDVVEQETGTRIRSSSDNSRNYPILVDENVIPNDIAAVTGSNEEATVDIIRNDEGPVHMSSKEGSNRKPDGEGKGGDGRVDEGREECVSGISVASGNDYTSLALDGGRYSILSSGSGNRNIRATGGDGGVEASRGRSDSGCRPTSGAAAVQIDSQDAETASSLRMEDLSTLVRVETDTGIEMQGVVVEAARHAEKGGEEAWKKVLAGLRVDMEGSPSRWFPIVRGGL